MNLRPYRPADTEAMLRLMHETVHGVNAADYTPAQLAAWCPGPDSWDLAARGAAFEKNTTLLAEENGALLGWADLDAGGYLDHLYVHRHHQGQGVATALEKALALEAAAAGHTRMTTHASLTARRFFENRGWRVVRGNTVHLRGEALENLLMEKSL